MKIILSPELLRKNPDTVYLFGDNLQGVGNGGQAVIRGEPNAFGVPTKKKPSMGEDSFFTDSEYEANVKAIDAAIAKIPKGKKLVIPDGIGTGLAQLDKKAPKTFAYLVKRLEGLRSGSEG